MKKLLLYLAIIISFECYSQSITVDTNKYTVPELVNSILINSPCISATNITWSTGTNFNSSNGIGFFENSNVNFPMKSGVILSTGDVNNAVGPNTTALNEGSDTWLGDTSLENTLAQAGIPMNSANATVLEFDFTPTSPHFSFDFLFASEEYGNFQCQFSDAFAFLLTNTVTGVTTNLAVVPNTTNPISVVTIRDFLYNSSCPSVNNQYFGSYNGGSAATSAPINFNGQTKLMNASATLTVNTLYHIKLVIADRKDPNSDSAIFIASDSFNIGQDVLGQDITINSNNAPCIGDIYTINSGLNPADYTFSWSRNGVIITGESGADLNITKSGIYSITYQKKGNSCLPITDEIKIDYLPSIITQNPMNLSKCDSGASLYTYDLSVNTTKVKNGLDPNSEVSYHASQADAQNNINPLPTIYSSNGNQTIYVRIRAANNPCFIVKNFKLLLNPAPVANKPKDILLCIDKSIGKFDLLSQNKTILNGQSIANYSVKYYESLADATNGTNQIQTPWNYNSGSTKIYAKVENSFDATCYSITDFSLIVNPIPKVDKFDKVVVCENFVLPALTNGNYFTQANGKGTPLFAGDVITKSQTIYIFNQPNGPTGCSASSSFDIKIIDPLEMSPQKSTTCGSFTLPPLVEGDYFTEPGGLGTMLKAGDVITTSQIVYVYFKSLTPPFCVIDTDFNITIIPTVDLGKFENVFDCTSYTLPPLSVGEYFTESGGLGTKLNAGDIITSTQNIYVYADSSNGCTSQASFSVVIGLDTPIDISQCEPYILPNLAVGNYFTEPQGQGTKIPSGTAINISQTVYIYAPTKNSPNCTDDLHFNISIAQPIIDILEDVNACESYTLPIIANGEYFTGPNGTGSKLNGGDLIFSTQTIYIYKESASAADCSNQVKFEVTVNPKPLISSRSDIDICNYYILTALQYGNYYTGPNGTGNLLPAGTKITTSQRIYIFALSNDGSGCTSENSFNIIIYPIEADSPVDVAACDSYTLPALTIGNYYTQSGGPINNNANLLHAGDVITQTTTLYVYAESGERINCTDENTFTITITKSPVVAPISNVFACDSYTLPALSIGNYYTGTNGTGNKLNAGDVITSEQTIFVYAETGTTIKCTDEKNFKVNLFNVDDIKDVVICENYTLNKLNIGNYYTQPNAQGQMLQAGDVINSSQTLYIYAINPLNPSCSDQSSFTVTIVKTPQVFPVPNTLTTVCDEDGLNDGITLFNLAQLNTSVLGSQTSSEYKVEYFASQNDAVLGINSFTITDLNNIYIKVSNTLTTNCYDIKSIAIIVNKLPEPNPVDGFICYDSKTDTLLNPYTIQSGLSSSDYSFIWYNEANEVVSNSSNYVATLPGIYHIVATNLTTGCTSEAVPVLVSNSEPAIVSYTVSEDFADNQTVTIVAQGIGGEYEYLLDDGTFQDSPIFYNVASGIHTITVRDKNGCGNTVTEAIVINYPKFFTPNSDGYNDTWNIKDLKGFDNSEIFIYDRQGKLITNIKPNSEGWDGSFAGKHLPSTDYWFVVNYTKDGNAKEFKSHFTLKR